MDTTSLSYLVPAAARSAHAELLDALGTEANPAQWMVFMSAVTRLLPDVLSAGRPTKEAIQRSIVGQLGHTSWQAMIEAPVAAGGLAWNWSGWKAWRRAWSVVEANPWLREQPLGSSEINAIAMACRKASEPFPASLAALDALRDTQKASQELRKADLVAELTDRLAKAEKTALAASMEASALRAQLDAGANRLAEQAELVGSLKAQIEILRAKAEKQPRPTPKLTRWQHLARAFWP